MTYINTLQDDLAVANAEIVALRNGLDYIARYCELAKFVPPNGYVNPDDISYRVRETLTQATYAADAARYNIAGPKPEASYDGWRCPVCKTILPKGEWNDTDTKAAARMRTHWNEAHTPALIAG